MGIAICPIFDDPEFETGYPEIVHIVDCDDLKWEATRMKVMPIDDMIHWNPDSEDYPFIDASVALEAMDVYVKFSKSATEDDFLTYDRQGILDELVLLQSLLKRAAKKKIKFCLAAIH